MPSQPDFERARQLSPHLFPADAKSDNTKLRAQVQFLAEKLAKLEGKSVVEILEGSESSLGKLAPSDPAKSAPRTSQNDAKFFGHAKKDVYYPIENLTKVPFNRMSPANIKFFKDEAEAKEANYKPAE